MKKAAFFVMMLVLFGFINIGLAQETLTITTYYPAPYGVYRELRSQRMAIGDDYIDATQYCWTGTCTDDINTVFDLAIQGRAIIGDVAGVSNGGYFLGGQQLQILGPNVPLKGVTLIGAGSTDGATQHPHPNIELRGPDGSPPSTPYIDFSVSGTPLTQGTPNERVDYDARIMYGEGANDRLEIKAQEFAIRDLNDTSGSGSPGTGAVRMFFDTNNNVGVGTQTPNNKASGSGYLDAQDVYLRDAGAWASELGGGGTPMDWVCEEKKGTFGYPLTEGELYCTGENKIIDSDCTGTATNTLPFPVKKEFIQKASGEWGIKCFKQVGGQTLSMSLFCCGAP